MPDGYDVAPLFAIRLAGAAFDHLEALATGRSAAIAAELLVRQEQLVAARSQAEQIVGSRGTGLTAEQSRAFRAALSAPAKVKDSEMPHAAAAAFVRIAREVEDLTARLAATVDEELSAARRALISSAATVLPPYLVFAAGEFGERAAALLQPADGALPSRNSRTRERERHLLLYLQRVCAKNDTFSNFGPSAWGNVAAANPSLQYEPGEISRRDVFLERWTAHVAAAAINADPESAAECVVRINCSGRLVPDGFVMADSSAVVPLGDEERAVLAACAVGVRLYSLGQRRAVAEKLIEQRVLICRCEVAPVDPHAFDTLVAEVRRWRDNDVRARWLSVLRPLAELPAQFANIADTAARTAMMSDARERLRHLGGVRTASQRTLYAATNPIAEECVRNSRFVLSEAIVGKFARDAAPWLDFWRDCYAFIGTRVAGGLRRFHETAPRSGGIVTLPDFLAHCAAQKMPLTAHGIVALAHIAFQEVKQLFRQAISDRTGADEIEFTSEDAQMIRRAFQFVPFDQYTYPTADVQLAAANVEALNRGEYRWIISELHPPIALLQHAILWGCPDVDSLGEALRATTFAQPTFHYGFFAADFTAHTTVRQMEVPRGGMFFVTPEQPQPEWPSVAPADAEVFVDETGDVGLRERVSGRYLGSFARGWTIPLGFHPFFFDRAPHTPRLRCGNTIVQRRAWTVSATEFSADHLLVAAARLRTSRGLPRFIYIRPTEQALRRSGAEGRDKDTKPVFIDFESYLSVEILQRWLTKAGEIDATEMLPAPDELLWQEADGRHTFELRMQIVPR